MRVDSSQANIEFIGYLLPHHAAAACLDDLQFTFGEQRRRLLIDLCVDDITDKYCEVVTTVN